MPDQEYPSQQSFPPPPPNGPYGYTPPSPQYSQDGHTYPPYSPQPAYAASGYSPAIPPYEASDISLNLVLSIFFGWIPALVFFLRRDQVSPITRAVFVGNMNFQLTRLLVSVGGYILAFLMVIIGSVTIDNGGSIAVIFSILMWIALGGISIAYFVISIVAAVQAKDRAMAGQPYQFPITIRFFS
ncbi:DUF4870 domain-containing protein [Actinomycetaceae bacterium WB03_NA08]|uniref:DUF4870 domain-containing protein n=1 Tax=Scrofimicrobium canadense TaxID=2652290 RepID=A0A6N7W4B3_9ACTO|nr:DUF4870 domain-containing protein [Scrofimicrobium canadense]MSS83353.1 DUF4870 domain-containing protein [Scrofimicrobium canadense]